VKIQSKTKATANMLVNSNAATMKIIAKVTTEDCRITSW